MSDDPVLAIWDRLSGKPPKESDADKLYPGNTPPRNLGQRLDSDEEDWLDRLPSQEFLVGGKSCRFYTIGAVATALGKQPVTIRSWEQKGWLPPASFRTPPPKGKQLPGKESKGRRLYTEDQIRFLVEAHDKYILSPRKSNWNGFKNYLKTQYPN